MVHVSGMSQRLLNFWGLRGAILNQSMKKKEGAREGNLHILTRCQFLEIPLSPFKLPPSSSFRQAFDFKIEWQRRIDFHALYHFSGTSEDYIP